MSNSCARCDMLEGNMQGWQRDSTAHRQARLRHLRSSMRDVHARRGFEVQEDKKQVSSIEQLERRMLFSVTKESRNRHPHGGKDSVLTQCLLKSVRDYSS